VLNYGVRDLTGMHISGLGSEDMESELSRSVRQFEPRIDAESLSVKAETDPAGMDNRAIRFEIAGRLWAQPLPEQLFIKTEMDLETGQYQVNQGANG
jgi:type VI secretion system protein ImpF